MFVRVTPDGIPYCRKNLHPLTPDNLRARSHGPNRRVQQACLACERERRAGENARRRAARATQAGLAPRPPKLRPSFTVRGWEADGYGYCEVIAEAFEYASDEDYSHRARRHLAERMEKAGIARPALRSLWWQEVDRDRDYANPAWTTRMVFRTVEPLFTGRQSEQGRAA